MTLHTFRLPDIGEGIAEAELGDWMVKVGDLVREDDVLCEVTTDKATVEIPAPFSGKIEWIGGKTGDVIAIGSDLVRIETDEAVETQETPEAAPEPSDKKPEPEKTKTAAPADPKPAPPPARRPGPAAAQAQPQARGPSGKPLAAPAVRGRARDLGIDLRQLRGTGPAGRITHEDLEAYRTGGSSPPSRAARTGTEDIPVTGIRRAIAERMALSKSRIPHFSIIEEVEVEALEDLRAALNTRHGADRGKLTLLPFIVQALAQAIPRHPEVNAVYDDDAGTVARHQALHCGIATQTDSGLMVPVLRHAEAASLWQNATEIRRLSEAARERRASPSELRGSTLTITSLGPLGALATTPVINRPEVAIVGINKIAVRPVWTGTAFAPRRMMNLSCSFDHRVVDGWIAAEFVATMKSLLETPALMFMEAQDD